LITITTGSLLPGEVRRIQEFANKFNTEVYVIGSRAAGTATELSDFDYLIGGTSKVRRIARRFLPRGKAGGEMRGSFETGIDIFNANRTPLDHTLPYIKFIPNL
jgi:Nucleotidyltransferase domain